jgi:hypothetical protein
VADQFEFSLPVGTRALTVAAALAYRLHTQQGALDYRVISVLRCARVLMHAWSLTEMEEEYVSLTPGHG